MSIKNNIFFYHSDHLCSVSYLTNDAGQVAQTLNHIPYGEDWVDIQHYMGARYSNMELYTFTGKERDEETGYSYFGARYYDADLLTGWLSVDPMVDKYPSLSPYNYCAWNPVKLVDSDGMEVGDYYSIYGEWLGTDGKNDNIAYIASSVTYDTHGRVVTAKDKGKLHISNSELLDRATWVCGESGGSGEYITYRTQNAGDASSVSNARVVDYYAYAINNASLTDGGFYKAARSRMGRMINGVFTKTFEGYFDGTGLGGNTNSKDFAHARHSDMKKLNQDTRFTNSISAVIKSVTDSQDPTGGCRAWLGGSDANKYVGSNKSSVSRKNRITTNQFSFNSNGGNRHHSFYKLEIK